MVTVYFETYGYAEQVAVFSSEALYMACLSALEQKCTEMGFDKITESVNENV